MSSSQRTLSGFWAKVKNRIVQQVPQEIQFCQFQCPHRECLLETGASCNLRALSIRPQQTLVVLRAAVASTREEWLTELPAPVVARVA